MKLHHGRKLFLLDAIRALISGLFLGFALPYFNEFIGMPKSVLYLLAALALFFGVYSGYCFAFLPKKWWIFLRGIAITNLLYCLLTSILVVNYWIELKVLGKLYFLVEIVILVALSIFELKKSQLGKLSI